MRRGPSATGNPQQAASMPSESVSTGDQDVAMGDSSDSREAAAEAAEVPHETSRTGSQALVVAAKIGSFLARVAEEPLEQVSGIITDKLKYVRWERSLRLIDRAQELMDRRAGRMTPRRVPLNVAIPVFEAASLEEDDGLQDVWANLLVNAVDADSGVEIKRALVSILQDFGPMEVRLLQAIHDAPDPKVPTKGLPDAYVEPGDQEVDPGLPPGPVQVGLWQLVRLGCITEAGTWDSLAGIRRVRITALGKTMVEACSETPRRLAARQA